MGLKRLVNGLKYVIFFLFCVKTYLEKKISYAWKTWKYQRISSHMIVRHIHT